MVTQELLVEAREGAEEKPLAVAWLFFGMLCTLIVSSLSDKVCLFGAARSDHTIPEQRTGSDDPTPKRGHRHTTARFHAASAWTTASSGWLSAQMARV